MKKLSRYLAPFAAPARLAAPLLALAAFLAFPPPRGTAEPARGDGALNTVLGAYDAKAVYSPLQVLNPPDGALFPRDMAAPEFRWEDGSGADTWAVTVKFAGDGGRLDFIAREKSWRPSAQDWLEIKRRALERPAVFTAVGAAGAAPGKVLSAGSASFSVSRDEVGAPIFYREVVLPFSEAVKDPALIKWRLGRVSDERRPPVVLEKLPVCGNCHSFSSDGSVLGMDVDYANDKGSYAIAPAAEEIVLDKSRIITWSDYKRGDGEHTFGLLSQVSPDGAWVISTVKDRSIFVAKPDLAYSQLFFPVKGVLAVYSRADGTFRTLPGADDKAFVQSNPAWTPDGKYVTFARAPVYHLKKLRDESAALLNKEECDEFLEGGRKFRFDLYRVPFNGGKGGRAEPVPGASGDGASNFFPKYSPDGKWLVFCKADSYMLLQPDSELYIMPAAGGKPRRMRCNRANMNSWHSWSPNGRWLVFASKEHSPYTRLFLTHVDANGDDTPPVALDNFTAPDRAANIPEFVGPKGGLIKRIAERFLDDLSFLRAAFERARAGDTENEIKAYRRALEINPDNPATHNLLGVALDRSGDAEAALQEYRAAVAKDPSDYRAYSNLATALARRGQLEEAAALYRKALQVNPREGMVHLLLGDVSGLLSTYGAGENPYGGALRARFGPVSPRGGTKEENLDEAVKHYREAARLLADPREAAMAHTMLGLALESGGDTRAVIEQYRKAAELDPGAPMLRANLGLALERAGRLREAADSYRQALALDPAMENVRLRLNALQGRGVK